MRNVGGFEAPQGATGQGLEHVSRVFDHRRPIYVVISIIMIGFCVPFGYSLFMASARGEVKVNGVAGNGSFQVLPAIFSIVIPGIVVVFCIFLLLTFWNERIEWKNGWIAHYNRLGKLTVKSPISDIYNVSTESTSLNREYVHDDGFDRSIRKTRAMRVVIETAAGEIKFYDHLPWSSELEALAKQAVRDKVPVREMKAWQG
jgi:hypothetical protein